MKRVRANVIKISDLAARRNAAHRQHVVDVKALWTRDQAVIDWLHEVVSGSDARSVRAREMLATWRPGDFGEGRR